MLFCQHQFHHTYIPVESVQNSICIELLFKLISFCFQNGKVPDLWLNGIINPIPKNDSGCKFDPMSYRAWKYYIDRNYNDLLAFIYNPGSPVEKIWKLSN